VVAAPFIGGHFVDRLLASDRAKSSRVRQLLFRREWHLARIGHAAEVVRVMCEDLEQLVARLTHAP